MPRVPSRGFLSIQNTRPRFRSRRTLRSLILGFICRNPALSSRTPPRAAAPTGTSWSAPKRPTPHLRPDASPPSTLTTHFPRPSAPSGCAGTSPRNVPTDERSPYSELGRPIRHNLPSLRMNNEFAAIDGVPMTV